MERNLTNVSVAKAKAHLSELIAKSSFGHERFVITRRNKPVAALVSLEDLQIIEQHEERQGLISVAGKWSDFEEVSSFHSGSIRFPPKLSSFFGKSKTHAKLGCVFIHI